MGIFRKTVDIGDRNTIDIQDIGGNHTELKSLPKDVTLALLAWYDDPNQVESFKIQGDRSEIVCIRKEVIVILNIKPL